jgi:outer membrane murein-binding lipoprotein Lpp
MELMRKLPPDNIPLVVNVVRTTLESLNIDVESIIADAKEKRAKIAERISGLEGEIAELEEEVAARREEIKALHDDAAETKVVQERLQMATGEKAPAGMSRPELSAPLLRPPGG